MKKHLSILVLSLAVALPTVTMAQVQRKGPIFFTRYDYDKRWHFGFSIGINTYDFYTQNSLVPQTLPQQATPTVLRAVQNSLSPGFNLQGIIDFRLAPNLNARTLPGLSFGTRTLNFYQADATGSFSDEVYAMKFDSYYIEIPLLLKYSAVRNSNTRPYIVAGGNLKINLSSKTAEKKGVYFGLKPVEPFVELGIGLDKYFYYFKLGVELKYSYGLTNLKAKGGRFTQIPGYEAYGNSIEKICSQMLTLAFNFE